MGSTHLCYIDRFYTLNSASQLYRVQGDVKKRQERIKQFYLERLSLGQALKNLEDQRQYSTKFHYLRLSGHLRLKLTARFESDGQS